MYSYVYYVMYRQYLSITCVQYCSSYAGCVQSSVYWVQARLSVKDVVNHNLYNLATVFHVCLVGSKRHYSGQCILYLRTSNKAMVPLKSNFQ